MQLRTFIALVALGTAFASRAEAQTATQTVTFQVSAINQVAVTGSPSLTVNTATAGSAPTAATATGSWAVTTNQTGAKITGSIASAMPDGVTLTANLTAPAGGATSAGAVSLGIVATDLVTGITKLNASALALTYGLAATAAAGVVASDTRVVTFTVTGGT
ncbi:MAG: hypothetical protein ACR2GJ_09220 [Gemmatimonadaceae bacterium]